VKINFINFQPDRISEFLTLAVSKLPLKIVYLKKECESKKQDLLEHH